MKPQIIVILGPTASGKSDIAVEIARKFSAKGRSAFGWNGAEIISADSRQVYKGLDIGTGKITKKEMRGVPHHMLDVINPSRQFTVADYSKRAERIIAGILKRGKLPIICGGTGFYISALLGESRVADVPPNPVLRKRLEKKSVEDLFKMLQGLDPERAKTIDPHNSRRLVRAIEIAKSLKSKQRRKEGKKEKNKYNVLKIGIQIPDDELRDRINKRISKWFKQGLIKEVEDLHKKSVSWKRMDELGLEYKWVSKYIKKEVNKEEMIYRMQVETWQYAKRQKTWFKRDKDITWISPDKNVIKTVRLALS